MWVSMVILFYRIFLVNAFGMDFPALAHGYVELSFVYLLRAGQKIMGSCFFELLPVRYGSS